MLTQEKANVLSDYLAKDEARASEIIAMDTADAVKALGADGIEITAEELAEYASAVEEAKAQSGELNEDALENVSGGCLGLAIGVGVGVAVVAYKTWQYCRWVRR